MAVRDKPIPEDLDTGSVSTGSALTGRATPQDFLQFSQADANGFERALDTTADAVSQKNERDEKMWALGQVSESKIAWNERIRTQMANKQEYPTDQFMKEYSDYVGNALDKAPSSRARDMLLEHFDAMAPIYARQSVMANAHAKVGKNNDQLNSLIDMLGGDSQNNSDLNNVKGNLKIGQVAIRDANADLRTKADAQSKLDSVAHDAAWKDASSDPQAGVEKIDNGDYDGLVHPTVLQGWKPMLLNAAKEGGQAVKYESDQQYESALHSTKFNGPTLDQNDFIKAYSLSHGKQAQAAFVKANDDFSYANEFYKSHVPMQSMPNNKIDDYLESFKPADDDPKYSLKNKLYNELTAYAYGDKGKGQGKNEAYNYDGLLNFRETDPFGYAANYSVPLSQQNQAVEQLQQKAQQDPSVLPQLQEEQRKLIQDSMVYQSNLGIPVHEQQVMSKDQAQTFADQLSNSKDIGGINQAVEQIKQNYGGYYPLAVRAMQELPEKGHQLGAGYSLLLANADNPVLSQKLGISLSRPEKEVRSLLSEEADASGVPKPNSQFLWAINNNPEFSTWKNQQRAFGANPDSDAMISDTQSALRKLTAQYVAEGQSIPDAASKAATDVFSNSYQAVRVHTTSMMNPFSWGGGGEKVLASRFDEMGKAYPQRFLDGLGEKLDAEKSKITDAKISDPNAIHSDIISNSKWVNMPDNQGVYLMYTGRDGSNQLVKDDQGQPLTRRFTEMLNHQKTTASFMQKLAVELQPQSLGNDLNKAADIAINMQPISF